MVMPVSTLTSPSFCTRFNERVYILSHSRWHNPPGHLRVRERVVNEQLTSPVVVGTDFAFSTNTTLLPRPDLVLANQGCHSRGWLPCYRRRLKSPEDWQGHRPRRCPRSKGKGVVS